MLNSVTNVKIDESKLTEARDIIRGRLLENGISNEDINNIVAKIDTSSLK
jgi:hypothetical protein